MNVLTVLGDQEVERTDTNMSKQRATVRSWGSCLLRVMLLSTAGPGMMGLHASILLLVNQDPTWPRLVTSAPNESVWDQRGSLDLGRLATVFTGFVVWGAAWPSVDRLVSVQRRVSPKAALALSLALAALFSLLSTLVANFWLFVAFQALLGLALVSGYLLPFFYILDVLTHGAEKHEDHSSDWLLRGILVLCGALVSLLCFFFVGVGPLAFLASNWRQLYQCMSAVTLICSVLIQAFLPSLPAYREVKK